MDESLVRKSVETGEDLKLSELLVQMQRCSIPFLLFDNSEWNELEADLIATLKEEYPEQINWDAIFPNVNPEYDSEVIVPRNIKEKYIRCYIHCESNR
jgi:hypothetical protein